MRRNDDREQQEARMSRVYEDRAHKVRKALSEGGYIDRPEAAVGESTLIDLLTDFLHLKPEAAISKDQPAWFNSACQFALAQFRRERGEGD